MRRMNVKLYGAAQVLVHPASVGHDADQLGNPHYSSGQTISMVASYIQWQQQRRLFLTGISF
jgi:hypothetical protein